MTMTLLKIIMLKFRAAGRLASVFGLAVIGGLLLSGGFAAAQETAVDAAGYEENLRRWQGLTEEERRAIREKVKYMDPQERRQLREKASRFWQLPSEERRKMRENFRKYRQLPPEQRDNVRSRYQRFRQMPPEKRQEIKRRLYERRLRQGETRLPESQRLQPGDFQRPGLEERQKRREEFREDLQQRRRQYLQENNADTQGEKMRDLRRFDGERRQKLMEERQKTNGSGLLREQWRERANDGTGMQKKPQRLMNLKENRRKLFKTKR